METVVRVYDCEEDINAVRSDVSNGLKWIRAGAGEPNHEEPGLPDHPAIAGDRKERVDSSEDDESCGGVPGVSTAGNTTILEYNLTPKLSENANGDPGGGGATGGIGFMVREKGDGQSEESNPGQV